MNSFPTANAIESYQSTQGVHSQDNDNSPHALSTNQLQQIVHSLSKMTQNHAPNNNDAYANAAGLPLFLSTSIIFVFTKPWILDSGAI